MMKIYDSWFQISPPEIVTIADGPHSTSRAEALSGIYSDQSVVWLEISQENCITIWCAYALVDAYHNCPARWKKQQSVQ